MCFSVFCQGRAAYENLLFRQDAELRLLENMKRCLSNKLKCDREYATSLTSIVSQGIKIERNEELSGSLIASAWRTMLDEFETTGQVIKQNADFIETKSLERLTNMIVEKRKVRKQFQEEYNRITQQFSQISEEVTRKKTEYRKYLEHYKMMRTRFEEIYVKAGRAGRKVDDVREKYQKACRKLHLTHNEYVLLICEAAECEKDYRTVLLPDLFEHQQNIQETFVQTWKEILQEIAKYTDLTATQFKEIQQRINNSLVIIKPSEEYKSYYEKNKVTPISPVNFDFDVTLVEDSGQLLANQLTVDNLTVDWLRNKMQELDTRIKEVQDKQSVIQATTAESIDGKTIGIPETSSRAGSNCLVDEPPRRELNELRCHERKLVRQVELIKIALNELGCEEAPAGCDIPVEHPLCIEEPNDNQKSENGIRSLGTEEWFHGVLPRDEVVRLLTQEGDFLVRETLRNDECQTVVSVCWNGGHKHFIVQTTSEGLYRFEGPSFPTIRELILYQYSSGIPVTSRSGAILRQPISRERWELNNDDVQLLDKIGRGNFGDVYKAQLKDTNQEVAVKICRTTLPEEQKKKFLQEGRILKQYDHPNIVKLIGICVQKQPIMIVMELVSGGSLLTFLRNRSDSLQQHKLLGMCKDVAAGMCYLESKNCIHRDLATRNCLVGTNDMVKISDFGMSREEKEYIVSDGMKQIPIKWTAPEALNFGKYTSLCDVWSYGILAWEIFSKGCTPYPGLSNSTARERIDAGYRMPAPDGTPEEMYRLMLRCWEYQPEGRPHFAEIYSVVEILYNALR
ncbi:tyrosine-protein kinase Fer isoform X2 [Chrysoperla carnea]|uniref:tyrosine-protein kinase Fer isoform X2 n=1 Tax=Chrysoperla carnea TaxID=189513 RepID=UPI001D087532|nr:tyrosine-protein kinase Fer isoform X2 [Chrysoperla carnea]